MLKVPTSIADTCPNRLGLKGMQTCIFCDEWGSAADNTIQTLPLEEQIARKLPEIAARYRAAAFLVYFQAYTTSFMAVSKLRAYFDLALSFEGVRGFVIGTRPDCVSQTLLDACNGYRDRCFVSIELGVQTFFDSQLEFLRRGHSAKEAIDCIRKIRAVNGRDLDLGIHLIFGLPGETDAHILETAELVSSLGIDHVKLHNLHVLKNTPLEELYLRGEFHPLDLSEYTERTVLFLKHLDPKIAVQRLSAVASRWDELVAPEWTRYKMKAHQFIVNRMNAAGDRQGDRYGV